MRVIPPEIMKVTEYGTNKKNPESRPFQRGGTEIEKSENKTRDKIDDNKPSCNEENIVGHRNSKNEKAPGVTSICKKVLIDTLKLVI